MKSFISYILFALLITLAPQSINGQDKAIDSLKIAFKNAKHDTVRCNILNALVEAESDDHVWPKYNELLLKLSSQNISSTSEPLKSIYLKHYASALNNIGYLAGQEGDNPKAINYYLKSLKISEEIHNHEMVSIATNNIGSIYFNTGNYSRALEYYLKSLRISEEIKDSLGIAQYLFNIGSIHEKQGDMQRTLVYYNRSLIISQKIKNIEGIANSLNNLANVYINLGDIPKAIEYYHQSLKLFEQTKDNSGIASTLNNIGLVYSDQGDMPKALEYFEKGFRIRKNNDDKRGMAFSLNNIGGIYSKKGDIKKALEYYNMSLKIREELNDKRGIASSLTNIGAVYAKQNNFNIALTYFQKSLTIKEELEDKDGIIYSLNHMASIMLSKGNVKEANQFANRSFKIAKELGYPDNLKMAAETQKTVFQKQNKYKEAFEMYELEIKMRDSIFNQDTRKASVKKQIQYQYEKKAAADSVKNFEERAVKNALLTAQQAQLNQEKTTRYALFGGLALVALFGVFMFNRFKVTQKQKTIIELKEQETLKQNEIISHQKHLVEEKHKEITDSINYAERIQRALLASKKLLDNHLKEYFILFKPKDIVSGDFYWATVLPNKQFVIVTADSTGHGVPGAIMSIVNIASLKEAVIQGINAPDLLLNETRRLIIENLKNDGSVDGGKDGMDGSLLQFDFENLELQCASANNPIWIIRSGELIEIKADRMPIGKHDKDQTPFTLNRINLQKGDVIYTLTDGFPDQFGGVNGKKFKLKQLQGILLSIASEPLEIQKQKLNTVFDTWKGGLEQVDDVCLIGIRV